jgi:ProP effector
MLPNRDTFTPPRDSVADAAIAMLAETWPVCFSVYERRRRPLRLGIHRDILTALDGAVTSQELSRALRYYTGNTWYLRALVAGAARVGLAGNPAGTVSAEEAAAAALRLAGRKKKRRQVSSTPASMSAPPPTPTSMPAPPPAPRIGLADLRRASQLRKAREAAAMGSA